MEEQLLETWRIHNRINLYMLDAVAAEDLRSVSASKGRNVGEQFAHIHNVRLMWVRHAAPDLLAGVENVEKDDALLKDHLAASLSASAEAIERLLAGALADRGRVKGFKPHAIAFIGYLISHESHHRGQIALILKQSGRPLSKKIGYGMWEWGVR